MVVDAQSIPKDSHNAIKTILFHYTLLPQPVNLGNQVEARAYYTGIDTAVLIIYMDVFDDLHRVTQFSAQTDTG